MRSLQLPNTDLHLSEMMLGAMTFGNTVSEEQAFQIMDAYYEAGGRVIDTADCYSFWIEGGTGSESELIIGRWMQARQNRNQMIIATKVGANPTEPGAGFEKKEGLSRPAIEKAIEKSLRNLRTDCVDIYYSHVVDHVTPQLETLTTYHDLVQAGKVRVIGSSNMESWRFAEARLLSQVNQLAPYRLLQQRFSYLRPRQGQDFGFQECIEPSLISYVKENPDVFLVAYGPLINGYFGNPTKGLQEQYRSADSTARLAVLSEIASELRMPQSQVVLAWMRALNPTVIPIIAASNLIQLEENLGSLHVQLSAEQLDRLNTASA